MKKEITRSFGPYGLILFMRAAILKHKNCPIENGLKISSLFEDLKKDLKDKNFLKNLIDKYLVKNKHMVKLTLLPDIKLEEKEKALEREKIDKIRKNLSPIEKTSILKNYDLIHEKKEEDAVKIIQVSDIA